MFRYKTIVIAVCLLAGTAAHAQKDYARKVVDTLASPYMGGRGYVDDGVQRAATYINSQYKSFGLLHFGKNYAQPFSFPVNTFPYPGKVDVSVNGIKQPLGAAYIVIPNSCAMKGTFSVERVTKNILTNKRETYNLLHRDLSKTFLLIDDTGATGKTEKELFENMRNNPFKAKGVIILCNKLTQEMSDSVANYVLMYALRKTKFDSATTVTVNIKNKFIKKYDTENLIGYIKGNVQPDTFIVFSAHYDHLGRMGSVYFPGANDNASGVAMLLSLAKYYSTHKEGLKYSVAFMAFTGEEMGLFGSMYYVNHPLFPLGNIKFEINMDIMGTGNEGITVVNGAVYDAPFHDMVRINDSLHLLQQVKPRGPTANSDHYFFYAHHVPSFFIYTMGGIKAYHDIYDRRETLPLTDFDNVYKLLLNFTADICNNRF